MLFQSPNFEVCKDCIDSGFSSVMFDGSALPYDENVAETKKVVEYAHARGVTVEAELGVLGGVEDDVAAEESKYTKPEEVRIAIRTKLLSLSLYLQNVQPMFLIAARMYLNSFSG